ncbi:hypothetical protein V5O48_004754 [Marasmius crinis-equi]|uniref:SMP-30/Gluconolactonase/LRE-like region domain-containing protein n=1 Tax=Marasmius crinis-equi TaxID=585013 RepID=A0ABR3FP65_9AGAR
MLDTQEVAEFGVCVYEFRGSLGEGPIYRAEDDTLHYVVPLSQPSEIHILPLGECDSDPENAHEHAHEHHLSDSISMLAFIKDHPYVYIGACRLGVATIDERSGDMQLLRELIPPTQMKQLRFNDGAVDSKGRLWIGELDIPSVYDKIPITDTSYIPQGKLWRYDPDGTATVHEEQLYCSNGIAWSLDDKWMFHNDSYGGLVRRYDFDSDTGALSNKIDWLDFRVEIPDDGDKVNRVPESLRGGEPDGMVIDSNGNLWIAVWGKGKVVCFSGKEQGVVLREIRAPKDTPFLTCPGWTGKDLDVLYCTSANFEGDEDTRTSKMFKLDTGKRWGVKGVQKYTFGTLPTCRIGQYPPLRNVPDFQGSLGEGPIYRVGDDTLHYVVPLSKPPELHIISLGKFGRPREESRAHAVKYHLSDSISMLAFIKDQPHTYIGSGHSAIVTIAEKSGDLHVLKELIPSSQAQQLRFNDGAVDCKGRLWVGEMDIPSITFDTKPKLDPSYTPRGRLWRYDPDGTATIHEGRLYCSNGIAWSLDNKSMFHNDSYGCIVRRYDFDAETGTLRNRIDWLDFRMEVECEGDRENRAPKRLRGGQPDGMIIDSDGNFWVALWGKGCVLCFSGKEQGILLREIRAPEDTPFLTCPAWAGKDLDILCCASANFEGREEMRTSKIFTFNVGKQWEVKGVEKYKFGA